VRNGDDYRKLTVPARTSQPTRSFPNEAAIIRLVGALMLEQNDEWQLQRRYMQLEGLQTVSDNVTTRISAVVTR
jgi:hypothetical protein